MPDSSTTSNPTTTPGGTETEVVNATSDPTSAINAPDFRFPSDLDTLDHWLQISSFAYSRESRFNPGASRAAYTGHIALPMPQVLGTRYSSTYTNQALGLMGLAEVGASGLWNKLTKIYGEQTGSDRNKSIADELAAAGGKLAQQSPGAATNFMLDAFGLEGIQVGQGIARNPHMAVLFQGVDFRTHEFNYDFVPRSKAESDTLFAIIAHLKRARAPSFRGEFNNHLFTYPDEFDITFNNDGYLFTIAPSVLLDISVNYHGQGAVYFRETKAPVAVSLSMTFQETTIITRESIDEFGR